MNKQLCIINSPAGSSTLSLSRFKKKTVLAKWPTCKRRYQRNRKKGALSASAGIFYSREYVWKCNLTLIMASILKSACTFSVFFYVIHLYTIESPRYWTHTSTCITESISEFMQTIFSCKQVRYDCVLLVCVCEMARERMTEQNIFRTTKVSYLLTTHVILNDLTQLDSFFFSSFVSPPR